MQNTKNLIFAIVLSTIILFGWQYFYSGPKEAQRLSVVSAAAESPVPLENLEMEIPPLVVALQDRKEVIRKIERIKINTDKLHGSISLKGARFDDLTLGGYKVTNEPDSEEVVMFSPSGSKTVYFAESGWISADNSTIAPDANTIWYTEDSVLKVDSPVTLSWDNNAGLKFFVQIEIDENYMFKITKTVENYGSSTESLLPYGVINRARSESGNEFYILHEGALGVFDGVLSEVRYDDLKDDKRHEFKDSKGWLGITDKYWLAAFIPSADDSFNANFKYSYRNGQNRYQADYMGQRNDIAPGERIEITDHLFAGAKKVILLDQYGKSLDIELFDRAVDFGWLYFITKPIFKLLTYFHHLLGNFGLAILMLTVTLKLLLFPLANKSYVSMHNLKRLQPQIIELKERHKDDKMAVNKAVMELYKKEKANPMAGCLPMIVQIPIFFALYKVLFVTIEMRHAPFYGWITDLSAADPTSVVNLFGLLPFNPPAFAAIGVWPLIMGLTMYLQQKMNPQPADPVQAKVMKMLPFIFIFVFATFPAGLVIYWAWNNTLSIFQQWVITRRLPK